MCEVKFLSRSGFGSLAENKIAYRKISAPKAKTGANTGLIWCGGLKSDMDGSKAGFLADWAQGRNLDFIRFDYFGHGLSSGAFKDGTISRWAEDTIAVIDELTNGPQILIGSSMGGWTALLAALARPERIKALVLIAPAPDFTEKLMWDKFDENIRRQIMQEGLYLQPSDYDEPYEISKALILDGRKNLLMDKEIALDMPIRILHGQKDTSVPWQYSVDLCEKLKSENIVLSLVKNGDHGMSGRQELALLGRIVSELI